MWIISQKRTSICTIWKLAYISAATSPSRISLSLQLTISSPKVTLLVGWRGVPPHYHATKPKGTPQTNKTHGSQLQIIFLWFFSKPLRSKTKTNTERHIRTWEMLSSLTRFISKTMKKVHNLLGADCHVSYKLSLMEKGWRCGHEHAWLF